MTKTNLTLSALLAATSGGLIYMSADQGKTVEQVALVADVQTDALLKEVDAATQAKISEVAKPGEAVACSKGETGVWDGTKRVPTQGWFCNGAFMPRQVATALDEAEAVVKVAAEIDAEPEVIEKP